MGRVDSPRDLESLDQEAREASRDWCAILVCSAVGYLLIVALLINYTEIPFPALTFGPFVWGSKPEPFYAFSTGDGEFQKPQGIKIIALVNYRQPERTSILNCYLQVGFAVLQLQRMMG